ncbi:Fc.00g019210.m01.CDS01 [Cosmosporella sp. VM-42]
MAEEQKNVEVPVTQETTVTPVVAPEIPVVETTKPAETPVETAAEDKVEEAKPAETTEEAPKAEEKKEEVKPVEEGHLGHKATGLSFPKNLIASKEFFFFGSDAVEPKSLSHYLKTEKSTETAHSNIAWASQTGEGLLFVGDKKTPSSVISLSDATEPETDGSHKFHFTSKGNKHSFKAASTAERDNWVAQLKLKIAAAKELTATVTESETYKSTVESFKPPPPAKKEEKPVEAPKEEAKTEEVAPVVAVPAVETPKEEEVKEEPKKEEVKAEEPKEKRRSASRKRASFFSFGKKEEKKVEEKKEDEAKPAEETAAVETPAETTDDVAPVPVETEAPKAEDVAPVTEAAPTTEETKPAEETPVESPKEKPATAKRNSFFGSVFSKKEKKSPELKPAEPAEAPKDDVAAETAPVIPPVEATTPLAVDVSTPATVPVETTEAPAATNGEPKKEVKEKRKSSLPFAFGKRDKSPGPSPSEEKKASPFSKLRATINRKTSSPKAEEKPAEEVKPEEPVKDETKTEETPAVEAPKEEAAKTTEPEAEVKPENVATTTPAVTAAA